tara:strand:+ start:3092 stop:3928 length:837 start_codon:yes stop_codon:yes gene_type:complete
MTKEKNTSSKKPVSSLKRLFTLGKNFSYRDLYDRAKKYFVEALGIFIVISFSFYVENKGIEYETTKSYEEMLNAFKKDIKETTHNIIEYKEMVLAYKDLYNRLLIRWDSKSDSLFMEKIFDLTSSLELFGDINKIPINTRGFNVFKMGGVDFELMNNELSEKITKFYERDISNIIENSSIYEKEIIDDYNDLIREKWITDLGDINLKVSEFWLQNEEYLKKDFQLKWIIRQRVSNYNLIIDDMDKTIEKINSTYKVVDSISKKMKMDTYFIYWKLNGD